MFRSVPTDDELTQVPLFADLSRKQLGLASRLSTPLDLPSGHVLARQGSVGAEFFIVLQGHVDVVQSGDLVATRGPGSPLGEIALLDARLRTATLIAQTPVHGESRANENLLASSPECPRFATDCVRLRSSDSPPNPSEKACSRHTALALDLASPANPTYSSDGEMASSPEEDLGVHVTAFRR